MRDETNNDPNEMTTTFCSSVGGLNPDLDDFGVTHASQDEVDCEHEILGTTIEDDWFEESDEETTDMSQLSPAFREIFNEYPEDEEDDDDNGGDGTAKCGALWRCEVLKMSEFWTPAGICNS